MDVTPTDPDAPPHQRQSLVLVPLEAPGVEVVRDLSTFGYSEQHGHGEVRFTDVRVPAASLLGAPGGGFAMAQARLGPGRVHHCMRALGMAERALTLMVRRAAERAPFGRPLAEQGPVGTWIAESRLEIDQARLLVLRAAWLMDTAGNRGARTEIAGIKVVARGPRRGSSTGPSRCSARPGCPPTRRWRCSTRWPASCASWTGRTRSTCAASPGTS